MANEKSKRAIYKGICIVTMIFGWLLIAVGVYADESVWIQVGAPLVAAGVPPYIYMIVKERKKEK